MLNSSFIMLVSNTNLLLRATVKCVVVPLELVVYFLLTLRYVVLLELLTSSDIPLGSKVQWRGKTGVPAC